MALKSFHRETLNDNWYEERASPLRGVLPTDGPNDYLTTTGTDFNGNQPTAPRQITRMINDANINEAINQTADLDWSRGFRSVLPRPDPEPDRYLNTTHRRAFINHFPNASSTLQAGSIIAGGPGCSRVERGKATSGAMGEVYKKSSEPQRDTLAQRSWLYSTDPMIAVKQKRAALGEPLNGSRPSSEERVDNNKPEGFGRKHTAITCVRKHHKGPFVDDEEELRHLW